MSEPVLASILGAKYATLIAGLFGSIVSLSFIKELTILRMWMSLLVGLSTALYGTPLAMFYSSLPKELNNGVAFFIGIFAMAFISVCFKLLDLAGQDPFGTIKKLLGKE